MGTSDPTGIAGDITDGNSRTLEFQSQNPGTDIDLLLVFEPPWNAGKLYIDLFPICWRVISFVATGYSDNVVVYTDQSALLVPQVESDNVVTVSNGQPCAPGQKCTLKTNDKGNNYLTVAENGTPGFVECLNDTGTPGDIGIGFVNSKGTKVEPAIIWNNNDDQSTLFIQLNSKLKIYASSEYQENEIIRGEIESPCLYEQNLIALRPSTTWNVSIDKGTGKVDIKQV